jgi:hypothetical protein
MNKEKKTCIFWIIFSIILIVLNIINGLRVTNDARLIQSIATALAGITFGIWFCEYIDIKRNEIKEDEENDK